MPVLEKRGAKLFYYPYSGQFAVRKQHAQGAEAGDIVFFDHAFADVAWRFGIPSFKSMTFFNDRNEVATFQDD